MITNMIIKSLFMLRIILPILLSFLIALPAYAIPATVYKINDGDTIRVVINGQKQYVRFSYIDAPEVAKTVQEATAINIDSIAQYHYGNIAKFYLMDLLPIGKVIELNVKGKDKYGRLIAEVYDKNKLLQEELLALGMVRLYPPYYKTYKDSKHLLELENSARENKLGMWEVNLMPPWLFRKQ